MVQAIAAKHGRQHEEESKEAIAKAGKSKGAPKKAFKIHTADSSHVQPLLQKLIAADPSWKEVANRNSATLRWVHPAIPDEDVLQWI